MTVPLRTQLFFWGGAFALFTAFVWAFGDILTPFVLGIAVAYLLNPLVDGLRKMGIPRTLGTLGILFLFFLFVTVLLVLVAPVAYRELMDLAQNIPGYVERLANMAAPYITGLQDRLANGYQEDITAFLKQNVGRMLQAAGGLAQGLASGGQAVAGFLTTLVLTPLVAFFMMREWEKITGWVEDLYPRQYEMTIRELLQQIDRKLSGFIRGQISVAFILGLLYAVALTIAGLHYGFLIGLGAGLLSIIPMVGSTTGLLVSVIVAWFQTGELSYVGIIAAIFIAGQVIEGNILTPKLVGDSVGLHPLWVMFALLAGGSIFGILGMLLAVPVAAVAGVLLSFAILQYKNSPLYGKNPLSKKKADKADKNPKKDG